MYKSTFQQIIFFILTTIIVLKTGKHMISIADIETFLDFGIVMLFFISFVFFLNYFIRLSSKVFGVFTD